MQDSAIQFRGTIYENGYGLIAQKVMRDKDLTPTAKSIYAYICSFAGVGKDGERTAFPGVSLMMNELGINSEKTYYKHRKQLIAKGYLTIEKRKTDGKFERNLYFIEAVPEEKKIEEKTEDPKNEKEEPYGKNYSTEKIPDGKISTMQKASVTKCSTNSTRSYHYQSLKEEEDIKENPCYYALHNFLQEKKIEEKTIAETLQSLVKKGITTFSLIDIEEQYDHIVEKNRSKQRIYDFPTYFANGLARMTEMRLSLPNEEQKEKRDTSFYFDWRDQA